MTPKRHCVPRVGAALWTIALAVLLPGCAATAGSHNSPPSSAAPAAAVDQPPSPLGKDWIFVQVDGFDGKLPGPPPVAGFIMTREGQRVTGTTACNRMGSGYELNAYDGTLRFTKLSNTRMMCDRVAADTEQAVLRAMIATDAYRIVDGTLELLSKGKVVARLTAP